MPNRKRTIEIIPDIAKMLKLTGPDPIRPARAVSMTPVIGFSASSHLYFSCMSVAG